MMALQTFAPETVVTVLVVGFLAYLYLRWITTPLKKEAFARDKDARGEDEHRRFE